MTGLPLLALLVVLLVIAAAMAWGWSRRRRAAKQLAEEKVREEVRLKTEAETKRLADQKRLAEEKAQAEAKAHEHARLTAEAKAMDEAEKARLAADAEELRLAEVNANAEAEAKARRETEAKVRAEAAARERSRLAEEAEAKRLADKHRQAEEKAVAEADAGEKAQLAAEAEAQRVAKENAKTENTASQATEETKVEIAPQSKLRDYRPLVPVSPTARPRPNRDRTDRQPRNTSLELKLQMDFGRDGGVKMLSLVPERREGMPNHIEIEGLRLNEWNDSYYDAVPVENVGDCLRQHVEWRGRCGARSWRWILSRRELHVLASGDVCGLYQFGSVPRLLLEANHTLLTAVSFRGNVEAALAAAGCLNFTVLDEATPGVPTGWLVFRDVKPTRAVPMRDEAHILNALCPLPDMEPRSEERR